MQCRFSAGVRLRAQLTAARKLRSRVAPRHQTPEAGALPARKSNAAHVRGHDSSRRAATRPRIAGGRAADARAARAAPSTNAAERMQGVFLVLCRGGAPATPPCDWLGPGTVLSATGLFPGQEPARQGSMRSVSSNAGHPQWRRPPRPLRARPQSKYAQHSQASGNRRLGGPRAALPVWRRAPAASAGPRRAPAGAGWPGRASRVGLRDDRAAAPAAAAQRMPRRSPAALTCELSRGDHMSVSITTR